MKIDLNAALSQGDQFLAQVMETIKEMKKSVGALDFASYVMTTFNVCQEYANDSESTGDASADLVRAMIYFFALAGIVYCGRTLTEERIQDGQ
jgi:cell division protein ZapA (FtsZ GTPase activity inhibitor)